jgi:hypothetical protein
LHIMRETLLLLAVFMFEIKIKFNVYDKHFLHPTWEITSHKYFRQHTRMTFLWFSFLPALQVSFSMFHSTHMGFKNFFINFPHFSVFAHFISCDRLNGFYFLWNENSYSLVQHLIVFLYFSILHHQYHHIARIDVRFISFSCYYFLKRGTSKLNEMLKAGAINLKICLCLHEISICHFFLVLTHSLAHPPSIFTIFHTPPREFASNYTHTKHISDFVWMNGMKRMKIKNKTK